MNGDRLRANFRAAGPGFVCGQVRLRPRRRKGEGPAA